MATEKVVPTAALQRSLVKALGTANSAAPHVEYLKELARVCPEIAGQVDELDLMHAHIDTLCRVGLSGVVSDLGANDKG